MKTLVDFQKRFHSWFDQNGLDLWVLSSECHSSAIAAEEEFLETLENVWRKMRHRPQQEMGDRGLSLFRKEWGRLRSHRKALQNFWGLHEEEALLLIALFRLHWDINRVSVVFGKSTNKVRFTVFESLRKVACRGECQDLRSRDCARHDLYLVDTLLRKKWNSTLGLYTESDFRSHEKDCERCRQLRQTFSSWIEEHLKPNPAVVPPAAWEFVKKDPGFSSRWVLFSWVSVVPWYVKLLLQVLGMAAVVLIVISVPYMGDLISSSAWDSLPRFSWRSASKATLEEEEVRESLEQESSVISGASVAASETVASSDVASAPVEKVTESSKPTPAPIATTSVSKAIQNMSPKTFFQWTATGKGSGEKADQVLALMQKYTVQKAGSLELGAQYRGGRYFHFSLPESDYDKLLTEVQALGFQHFRQRRSEGIKVRPQGQARIVLLIRELD